MFYQDEEKKTSAPPEKKMIKFRDAPKEIDRTEVNESRSIESSGSDLVYTARVTNLHYPSFTSIEEAIKDAESSFKSYHYRKAIKEIHPQEILPKKVNKIKATARLASEVEGFDTGIVVDVKVWYCENPEKVI